MTPLRSPALALLVCALTFSIGLSAQAAPPASAPIEEEKPLPPDVVVLETMVVRGVQPGPGLWKVKKGDHVLWVLGTVSPLPDDVTWQSREVMGIVRSSQAVIGPPGAKFKTDTGFFSNLFLLPSLFKARKNPEGRTLKDLLPADQYARWQVLKKKYIGGDAGIEKWRPIFAAQELYMKGVEKSGLVNDPKVWDQVRKAAAQAKIGIYKPSVEFRIADPKKAIKDFTATRLDDTECFVKTMDFLERDLRNMMLRGNAWAIGEVGALKQISYTDNSRACINALLNSGVAQNRGWSDLGERIAQEWLRVAEAELARNPSTLAVLPMGEVLKPNGYLARLRAKGYVIEEPADTHMP